MLILPAIDIKEGRCVRLTKGDFATVTKVAEDAVDTARAFEAAGAGYIHMVDLDGAVTGKPENEALFLRVAAAVRTPVEVGGGIRDMETVERYLGSGIARVILGSSALKDPEFARAAISRYGERIAVGIDARDGLVSVSGWLETSQVTYLQLAKEMEKAGVGNIIYTDIGRDGTLMGPNLAQLEALSEAVSCPITASGGIRDIGDIRDLLKLNLYGAICGKSIYSGTLDLKEAIALAM